MSTFRCPVMTIPPPQPGPSGSSSPGVLPSSSLPSPNTPGPEFQINLTDTNACTQLYALMRTHSDVHEEGQACAETHRRSPGGKQTHWTSLKNTGPHSQTHGLGEREVQREPAAQRATVVHPEMTAANAPICTERDTPSHCHGHVHGARTPRASGHTCTQTRVMHTYRGTRARTRLGNLYRDARRLCETVTHRETLALGVHTHIHTPPGTPFFPLLTPFPPFPSPLTSLGQSHPSSFRSKSASSQGGERCQCAFSPPPPRLASSACPPLPMPAWDAHTSAAQDCTEMRHVKETGASSHHTGELPSPPGIPTLPQSTSLVSGCPRAGQSQWLPRTVWGWALWSEANPTSLHPGSNARGSRQERGLRGDRNI